MQSINHQTRQTAICILTLAILCFAAQAVFGYKLNSMYVQSRTYENSDSFNRLYFEITDDSDHYIPESNVVTDVKLYHPNGTQASISEITRPPDSTIMLGGYDGDFSYWYYNSPFMINDYHGRILDDLALGSYRLVVTTDDAQTHELTYQFNQKVNFPLVSSSSFEIHPDASGNLFWTWEISDEIIRHSEYLDTKLTAYVSVYNDEAFIGVLWVTAPTHLGRLYIPHHIAEEIASMGNRFRFGVALRTVDNNNRAYSDGVWMSDLQSFYPATVEAFVARFYQQCLNRDPDKGGLEYWVNSLTDGSRTGADVARGFVFSQEFVNRAVDDDTYLYILYRAFFNRLPDHGGFDNWQEQLRNQVSREKVLDGFIFAQEFYNLCADFGIKPN